MYFNIFCTCHLTPVLTLRYLAAVHHWIFWIHSVHAIYRGTGHGRLVEGQGWSKERFHSFSHHQSSWFFIRKRKKVHRHIQIFSIQEVGSVDWSRRGQIRFRPVIKKSEQPSVSPLGATISGFWPDPTTRPL